VFFGQYHNKSLGFFENGECVNQLSNNQFLTNALHDGVRNELLQMPVTLHS
jgi:hypothetical protein